MDHLNPRNSPRNVEIIPRLALVTPAMVAARAKAASAARRSNQQGPHLRRRVASKKFSEFEGEKSDESAGEEEVAVQEGGAVDLGETTEEEGDRGSLPNLEDFDEEERHFGKRRMVGSYETGHVLIPRQLLHRKEVEKTRSANGRAFTDRLIPIRLELDLEGLKIKDLFTWNIDG